MEKRKKALYAASGAAACLAAGLAHRSVARYFVDVALNREVPRHIAGSERMISGYRRDEETEAVISAAAAALKHCGCEDISIRSKDGLQLSGHWRPHPQAERIIIAMHGWRSSWDHDFGCISNFWYENRCSVLFAEQRAQNNSDGEYMSFGLKERFDCLEWLSWVREKGNLPIYLAGISMGASTVLMASGLELPGCVHGIMADCGYTSPPAIWKHVMENNLHLHYNLYRSSASQMFRKRLRFGIEEESCPTALQRCHIPVLFIHGTEDRFVPVEMSYENYRACTAPKQLFIVPGAHHGMSYLTDRIGYENCVKSFWELYDKKTAE